MVKKLVTWYKGFSSFQFGSAAATFSLDVVTARITLAPLGGGPKGPPCGFSQIAPEVLGISL